MFKRRKFLKLPKCKILDLNCEDDLVTSYSLSNSAGAKTVDRKLAVV